MFVKLMKGEQKVWIKETERETSTAKAEKPRKIAWQGKRGETLKSAGVRALRGRDIKRVYPRASERRQERRTRRKARSEAPLHFQVQECRFDKHLVFFFFLFFLEKKKKKKPMKSPLSCLDWKVGLDGGKASERHKHSFTHLVHLPVRALQ